MMSETVGNYVESCHTTFGKILIFINFIFVHFHRSCMEVVLPIHLRRHERLGKAGFVHVFS